MPPTHGMCATGCIPYAFEDACQGTFEAQGTNDNGACAIHSVFGTMDYVGQYFCKDARQFFCDGLAIVSESHVTDVLKFWFMMFFRIF